MDPDVIGLVIKLLPDSYGTRTKRRILTEELLANASMFDRCNDGPWLSYSQRGRPGILPNPVAVVRFTPEQWKQHGMPGWDPDFTTKLSLPVIPPTKETASVLDENLFELSFKCGQ
jgi:hypothetical protein